MGCYCRMGSRGSSKAHPNYLRRPKTMREKLVIVPVTKGDQGAPCEFCILREGVVFNGSHKVQCTGGNSPQMTMGVEVYNNTHEVNLLQEHSLCSFSQLG